MKFLGGLLLGGLIGHTLRHRHHRHHHHHHHHHHAPPATSTVVITSPAAAPAAPAATATATPAPAAAPAPAPAAAAQAAAPAAPAVAKAAASAPDAAPKPVPVVVGKAMPPHSGTHCPTLQLVACKDGFTFVPRGEDNIRSTCKGHGKVHPGAQKLKCLDGTEVRPQSLRKILLGSKHGCKAHGGYDEKLPAKPGAAAPAGQPAACPTHQVVKCDDGFQVLPRGSDDLKAACRKHGGLLTSDQKVKCNDGTEVTIKPGVKTVESLCGAKGFSQSIILQAPAAAAKELDAVPYTYSAWEALEGSDISAGDEGASADGEAGDGSPCADLDIGAAAVDLEAPGLELSALAYPLVEHLL
eukprot:tig00020614_g12132.t1